MKILTMFTILLSLVISGCTYYYGAAIKDDGTLYLTYAKGFIFYKNGVYRCNDEGSTLTCMDVPVEKGTVSGPSTNVFETSRRSANVSRVEEEARQRAIKDEAGRIERKDINFSCPRFAQAVFMIDSKLDRIEMQDKCKKAFSDPDKKAFVECITSAEDLFQYSECLKLMN